MKRWIKIILPLTAVAVVAAVIAFSPQVAPSSAEPEVDAPAPDFTLVDTDGASHTLSDYQGKYVVLEWLNYDCPFVGKHYGSGHMQMLQERYTGEGVVWLSIVSSAPGTQGYFEPEAMNARTEKEGGHQTAVLLDPSGDVGHLYGARTTPHMFVIDPEGTLRYKGGIDDKPTTRRADIETATNYVEAALDALMDGKPVEVKTASPYGCSVKYAH